MRDVDIVVKYNMLGPLVLGYGGSLYVALEIAIGLAKNGYSVCFNPIVIGNNVYSSIEKITKFFGISLDEFRGVIIGRCSEKSRVVKVNACGDVLTGSGDIVYLHFPIFSKPKTYYPELYSFFNTSAYLYYFINKAMYRIVFKDTVLFLANSKFTSEYVEKTMNIKPQILYPPVFINDFLKKDVVPLEERDRTILYVSRISYEKQPYNVLILANILKELGLNDWKIVYAGSSSLYSDKIIEEIYREASKRELSKFIVIKKDLSRREIIELYRKSYAYIHLFQNEHFGISIVEAMSSGTPVIIPTNSGSWIDIAMESREYALPYSNWIELRDNLIELINNPKLWNKLSTNSRRRSMYFSRERFHEKISKYVDEVIKYKKG